MTNRAKLKIHNSRPGVTGGRFTHCPKCGALIDGSPRCVRCGPMPRFDPQSDENKDVDEDRTRDGSRQVAEGTAPRAAMKFQTVYFIAMIALARTPRRIEMKTLDPKHYTLV